MMRATFLFVDSPHSVVRVSFECACSTIFSIHVGSIESILV
jgi:hypothetical protein